MVYPAVTSSTCFIWLEVCVRTLEEFMSQEVVYFSEIFDQNQSILLVLKWCNQYPTYFFPHNNSEGPGFNPTQSR